MSATLRSGLTDSGFSAGHASAIALQQGAAAPTQATAAAAAAAATATAKNSAESAVVTNAAGAFNSLQDTLLSAATMIAKAVRIMGDVTGASDALRSKATSGSATESFSENFSQLDEDIRLTQLEVNRATEKHSAAQKNTAKFKEILETIGSQRNQSISTTLNHVSDYVQAMESAKPQIAEARILTQQKSQKATGQAGFEQRNKMEEAVNAIYVTVTASHEKMNAVTRQSQENVDLKVKEEQALQNYDTAKREEAKALSLLAIQTTHLQRLQLVKQQAEETKREAEEKERGRAKAEATLQYIHIQYAKMRQQSSSSNSTPTAGFPNFAALQDLSLSALTLEASLRAAFSKEEGTGAEAEAELKHEQHAAATGAASDTAAEAHASAATDADVQEAAAHSEAQATASASDEAANGSDPDSLQTKTPPSTPDQPSPRKLGEEDEV